MNVTDLSDMMTVVHIYSTKLICATFKIKGKVQRHGNLSLLVQLNGTGNKTYTL